jgi:hypothetical protein
MTYTYLATAFVVIAVLVLLFAGRMLFRNSWFLAWLRGMVGLFFIGLAIAFGFVALDLYGYKQLTSEQHIATLSFDAKGDQLYGVNLVDNSGVEREYELYGDLWQLDARLLLWNARAAGFGIKPGYKLERLAGRYLSLEQEREGDRSVFSLSESSKAVDIWALLYKHGQRLDLVSAKYGSATYMPMADKALFAVYLTTSGLIARPLNEPAQTKVTRWQ